MFVAETMERIAHRLSGDSPDPGTLGLIAAGREFVRFRLDGEAVRASLCMPNGKHVDVSRSPRTVCSAIDDAARTVRADPAAWRTRLVARLSQAANEGWRVPQPIAADGASLEVLVLALTHPALVQAVDAGLQADDDVPAWASPALRHQTLPRVTSAFFAETTRPVRNALGRLLARPAGGRLEWWTLAVSVAAAPHVEADDVAALLRTTISPLPVRTPSVEHVSALRALFANYERDAVLRIARAGLRDVASLRDLVRLAARSSEIARLPVTERPTRLDDLVQMARSGARPAPPRVARAAVEPAEPPRPDWAVARTAPSARNVRRTTAARFDELRAALDGRAVGDLTIEAPRSPEEFRTWAAVLDNCLASYGDAFHRRRSLVLAVRREGRIVAALEIDPHANQLRQFLGPRNRAVAPGVVRAVVEVLHRAGVST
jgi:hypothetical protein